MLSRLQGVQTGVTGALNVKVPFSLLVHTFDVPATGLPLEFACQITIEVTALG